MGLMEGDYPTSDARRRFYGRLLRDLSADPEFEAAALTTRFRMVFSGSGPVEVEGKEYKSDRDRPNANSEQVTGGFFRVTGQRLLEGRTFTDEDVDSRLPVTVVNAAFAQKHFGNASALGRRFRTIDPNTKQPGPWRSIVGVVSTVRMLGPFNNPGVDDTGFYVPFYSTVTGPVQPAPLAAQFATVVVKPRGERRAESIVNALRRDVAKADVNLPLYFVGTPKAQIDVFVAQNRIIAVMFLLFGGVAVVLASVGIYGVMSFAVNQRTQEFGVRLALGATDARIVGMVLRQGIVQIAAGLALGLGAAFGLAALIGNAVQNTLFGVSARDPLTYGAVITLIAVVSLTATLVPARRASRVDPMTALRAE
jgi:predicted permease